MQDFAKRFYKSRPWQDTSRAYAKSVGGLCESCMRQGVYKAGELVHHKIHITPENINDPNITLNWNNLELLCRECHAAQHDKRKRRYRIDELGRVIT